MASGDKAARDKKDGIWRYWPRFFLIIPFALVVWPPFYNRIEPTLVGIPFFYWYQLAAILLAAVVVMGVYVLERRQDSGPSDGPEAKGPPPPAGPGASS